MRGPSAVLCAKRRRQTPFRTSIISFVIAVLSPSFLATGTADASTANVATTAARAVHAQATPYPIGVFDFMEPSYYAPPPADALPGYTRAFVDDFTKQPSPTEWFYFRGVPVGDPAGRFDVAHVSINHGMLKIGTWRDPRFNNQWVSGGLGLRGYSSTYGAYFVRSRETAPGPDTSELLWYKNSPSSPEINFDETGEADSAESWVVNYDPHQDQVSGSTAINIEHWHTWGVIWTPTSITFTVDGHAWGTVAKSSEIPRVPMTLDIESKAFCGIPNEPCPTNDSMLIVDWVEEYTPSSE
jgi:Glycosyl hydrolases family 16